MLTFSHLQSVPTTELTPCASAEHAHGCAHGECPPTDTARTGAAAQAVRAAEHAATYTDLRHTGAMARATHMSAAARRGPPDCDFIDFKERRTERCAIRA